MNMFYGSEKPVTFPCQIFASKMEYHVLVLQIYIERSSQLLSTVKKALATAVLYDHITMGTTALCSGVAFVIYMPVYSQPARTPLISV